MVWEVFGSLTKPTIIVGIGDSREIFHDAGGRLGPSVMPGRMQIPVITIPSCPRYHRLPGREYKWGIVMRTA